MSLIRCRNNSQSLNAAIPLMLEFFLSIILDRRYTEAIGDLEERHDREYDKSGYWHARFWLWKQVIVSLTPFILAALKRVSGYDALVKLWWNRRG
jgi:hypothetical protein